MQLNGFTFDQDRLKRLNAQAVQRWCAVQENRMLANHLFQDVPNNWRAAFDFFLRRFNRGCNAQLLKACKDKGFEEFERHQLRQTALVQFQSWAHGNH